jgi:integrase
VAFGRVCSKLEIHDFRFHDLRPAAASWLRMQGAHIHTVTQLPGHKGLGMAARYQNLSLDFLAETVNRLDRVFRLLSYQDVTDRKALMEATAGSNVN